MTPVPTPWGDAWVSPSDPVLDVAVMPASGALVIGAPTRLVWD